MRRATVRLPFPLAPRPRVYNNVDMKAATTTIRIPAELHEELRGFAEEGNSTLTGILVEALELYRRERFVARVNAGYSLLREETAAWKEHRSERKAWNATLEDGLPAKPKRPRRKS